MRTVGPSRRNRRWSPFGALWLGGVLAVVTGCRQEQPRADRTTDAGLSYNEPHRPQLHFSPASGWMNDPNGLVYHAGMYHLFYQYYPDSTVWGPMHWGHAVSRDLLHWTPQPIALRPDTLGYIFSGSAVVDSANTSRLGATNKPPLVAMFTYHNMAGEKAGSSNFQSQAIAWSVDDGRSWTKYAANPVIPNPGSTRDFRDPKVTWDADRARWVVVLAAGDHAEFWGSPNLTTWTKLSEFGKGLGSHDGVWECPDFFPMTVEGTGEQRWVLLQSVGQGHPNGGTGTQYFVGDFDGTRFTVDPPFAEELKDGKARWLDYGRDDYAGVTWANAPDGRRLFLGWMSNWQYATRVPTQTWRSAMTIPRELALVHTTRGYRLRVAPVAELASLRTQTTSLTAQPIDSLLELTEVAGAGPQLLELELVFVPGAIAHASFGVELRNARGESYRVGFDARNQQWFSDRTKSGDTSFAKEFAPRVSVAPTAATDSTVRMHLLLDVASAELFADGGLTTMTEVFFPTAPFDRIRLFAEFGDVRLMEGRIHRLRGIWGRQLFTIPVQDP